MTPSPPRFDETIAHHSDARLGPFLLEPFARDLTNRADLASATRVLELACGTGRLTRHLLTQLPPAAHFTATALDAGMLAQAQAQAQLTALTAQLGDQPLASPLHVRAFTARK